MIRRLLCKDALPAAPSLRPPARRAVLRGMGGTHAVLPRRDAVVPRPRPRRVPVVGARVRARARPRQRVPLVLQVRVCNVCEPLPLVRHRGVNTAHTPEPQRREPRQGREVAHGLAPPRIEVLQRRELFQLEALQGNLVQVEGDGAVVAGHVAQSRGACLRRYADHGWVRKPLLRPVAARSRGRWPAMRRGVRACAVARCVGTRSMRMLHHCILACDRARHHHHRSRARIHGSMLSMAQNPGHQSNTSSMSHTTPAFLRRAFVRAADLSSSKHSALMRHFAEADDKHPSM